MNNNVGMKLISVVESNDIMFVVKNKYFVKIGFLFLNMQ